MFLDIAAADATKLRFQVGQRVQCNYSDVVQCPCKSYTHWLTGTVVELFYVQEDTIPTGKCAPYRVFSDIGLSIYVPTDRDECIRGIVYLDIIPPSQDLKLTEFDFMDYWHRLDKTKWPDDWWTHPWFKELITAGAMTRLLLADICRTISSNVSAFPLITLLMHTNLSALAHELLREHASFSDGIKRLQKYYHDYFLRLEAFAMHCMLEKSGDPRARCVNPFDALGVKMRPKKCKALEDTLSIFPRRLQDLEKILGSKRADIETTLIVCAHYEDCHLEDALVAQENKRAEDERNKCMLRAERLEKQNRIRMEREERKKVESEAAAARDAQLDCRTNIPRKKTSNELNQSHPALDARRVGIRETRIEQARKHDYEKKLREKERIEEAERKTRLVAIGEAIQHGE